MTIAKHHKWAVLAALLSGLAMPAIAQNPWSDVFVDTPGDGGPACMALNKFDDATFMTLKMDRGDRTDGVVVVMLSNLAWSIEQGEELGEVDLVHDTDGIAAPAHGGNHGLFFYTPRDWLRGFAASLPSGGFALYRDGTPVTRFPQDGFAETLKALLACADREFRP